MKQVTFAGGCFWCVEHDLKNLEGVMTIMPGYANATSDTSFSRLDFTPNYQNHNGYREAVKIEYNETKTSFKKLCQFFLDSIDPTDDGGQFYDRGESYKTAIYYSSEVEQEIAKSLLAELADSKLYSKPIAVDILPAGKFFDAEEYHRDYAAKNPEAYMRYRNGSGREGFVQNVCLLRANFPWKD